MAEIPSPQVEAARNQLAQLASEKKGILNRQARDNARLAIIAVQVAALEPLANPPSPEAPAQP